MKIKILPAATGDDARAWLARNTHNRRMSEIRVEQIAGAILRNEWRPCTDLIGIDGSYQHGSMFNGQHRAGGLDRADQRQPGITIPLAVAYDLGPDSGLITDTGRARSLEDTLFFLGEDEARPRLLSAAVNLAWHVTQDTYRARVPVPTRMQQIDFLKNEATDLRDAVPIGAQMSRGIHVPASGLMAAVWMIGRGDHVNRLEQFVTEVAHGEGLSQRDATYRLRELFIAMTANRSVDRGRPWKICALTTYVWNQFIEGTATDLTRVRLTEIPTPS